jgi:hypothetical protein
MTLLLSQCLSFLDLFFIVWRVSPNMDVTPSLSIPPVRQHRTAVQHTLTVS